jgi:hypothetical protein
VELHEFLVGTNGAIWAASLSAAIASCALLVNAYVASQAIRTRELQLFERVFSELLRLERDIVTDDDPPKKAIALRSPFLNTLEYASPLLNHCYIREPPLRQFFSWSFEVWYRHERHVTCQLGGNGPLHEAHGVGLDLVRRSQRKCRTDS